MEMAAVKNKAWHTKLQTFSVEICYAKAVYKVRLVIRFVISLHYKDFGGLAMNMPFKLVFLGVLLSKELYYME